MAIKVKNKTHFLFYTTTLLVVLSFFITSDLLSRTSIEQYSKKLSSRTQGIFCEEYETFICPDAPFRINYTVEPLDKILSEIINVTVGTNIIRLRKISIQFVDKVEKVYQYDFYLYRDSNNNGHLDLNEDHKLARGLSKGKRIVFESLNREYVVDSTNEAKDNFFIYSKSGNIRTELIKDIEIDAVNLTDGRKKIKNNSVYYDLSKLKHFTLIDQPLEIFLKSQNVFKYFKGKLITEPGEYNIDKTIVIPKGTLVEISAGTTLKMKGDVSIVSYSPVNINGSDNMPVIIESQNPDVAWGVFGIIGSTDSTELIEISNLKASGGSETHINNAYLSGMISIYKVDKVVIQKSEFSKASADDSLSVKYADVEIQNNKVYNNNADGIDGDWINGQIKYNDFRYNGNDGLDLSGSSVEIYNNAFYYSEDKGISLGENTTAKITDNVIDGCAIGIQIKEAEVLIGSNKIENSKLYGIDSYKKKNFFMNPSAQLNNNQFTGNTEDLSKGVYGIIK